MAATTAADLDALRSKVRAHQHVRSFPLIVLGALLANYGVVSFSPTPISWRYAAPLSFVLVWGLSKLNERQTGVGGGRADYLVAAAFVFTATNLVLLRGNAKPLQIEYTEGLWLLVVAVALAALGRADGDWVLMTAAAAIGVCAALLLVPGAPQGEIPKASPFSTIPGATFQQNWPYEVLAIVGAVLFLAGLAFYSRERRES